MVVVIKNVRKKGGGGGNKKKGGVETGVFQGPGFFWGGGAKIILKWSLLG